MQSPFPGMDPYIEQPSLWADFHADLAGEIRAMLNRSIQPRYVALLAPHTTYEVIEIAELRSIRPDLGVLETAGGVLSAERATGASPAPVLSAIPNEVALDLYSVEVRRTDDRSLVTAIEILSPVTNRPGHRAYADYRRKRADLLHSGAHFIELDLLRAGERSPLERSVPPATYYLTLSRVERRPTVEVWPLRLQDPLPVLPVPLRSPDPDAALDLGQAAASVYERAGYGSLIDYAAAPPPPPMDDADRAWLDTFLRGVGRR